MRKKKANVVKLPEKIDDIAKNLSNILIDNTDNHLNKILENNQENSKVKTWESLINKVLPQDINKWSSKDFVHWFSKELYKEIHIPYVIEYSRDCAAIKRLKDQFLAADIKDVKVLQEFLIWTIKNYYKLKDEISRFDLPILSSFINEFLQNIGNQDTTNRRSIGINIKYKMEQEINKNPKKAMINILKQFGIPLATTFYNRIGFEEDKINEGIYNRVKRLGENNIDILQNIMQISINFSPYPDWFNGLNWRDYFKDIINQYQLNKEKWWRDNDYGGDFAIEYEDLR